MIDSHFEQLAARAQQTGNAATLTRLPNGGALIKVADVKIADGWNRPTTTVLFVAPPGYPAAQPDCFWVEPAGLRLSSGGTPQASNDANPIPGDIDSTRKTTWFSWHVQSWNPSRDTLETYYKVILNRLNPAR